MTPTEQFMRIFTGAWVAHAVSAAARLGVADVLGGRRLVPARIAEEVGADSDAMARLLRLLAVAELVEGDETAGYALTSVGALLREDGTPSLRALAMLYGEDYLQVTWSRLHESVLTGEPEFERANGLPIFDYLAGHREKAAVFNAGMAAMSFVFDELPAVYDFSRAGTVVDLGGGTGTLLGAVLRANPSVRGVLFDLPRVVAAAPDHLARMGVAERCTAVGGDLFARVPPGGDVYVLSRILHDWDDDRCAVLLANCAEAMRPGAELVVVERIVSPDAPHTAAFDLQMMVVAGGRERTEGELRTLLDKARLTPGRVLELPLGMRVLTATR